jgi:hypothetical protein
MLAREQGWQFDNPLQDVWSQETCNTGCWSVYLGFYCDVSSDWLLRYINNIKENRYQHAPPQCSGDIIADHMGLGKSLSMIALVASTFRPSCETMKVGHSRCTLLIIPSNCKWRHQTTVIVIRAYYSQSSNQEQLAT